MSAYSGSVILRPLLAKSATDKASVRKATGSAPNGRRCTAEMVLSPRFLIRGPFRASMSMLEITKSVQSFEGLRQYVADTLSDLELLNSDQFQLSQ